MSYRTWRTRGAPMAANGMTLTRAVKNPQSNIARIVKDLRENGPTTKRDLLERVLGKGDVIRPKRDPRWGWFGDTCRGYASYTFGLAVKLGILTYARQGRSVVWSLGPMERAVVG